MATHSAAWRTATVSRLGSEPGPPACLRGGSQGQGHRLRAERPLSCLSTFWWLQPPSQDTTQTLSSAPTSSTTPGPPRSTQIIPCRVHGLLRPSWHDPTHRVLGWGHETPLALRALAPGPLPCWWPGKAAAPPETGLAACDQVQHAGHRPANEHTPGVLSPERRHS